MFDLDDTNKTFDHVIYHVLQKKTKFIKFHFDNFQLTFNFIIPKERDINYCHVTLQTKLTHTHNFFRFIQRRFLENSSS